MRITNKHIFFWGSIFSNFYPCVIVKDGETFYSSEQYFMYKKALYFNDEESASKILSEKNPSICKKYGRKVKNFDTEIWNEVSTEVMEDALMMKFSQNKEILKEFLSSKYDNKDFVEASPYDAIWGIKMDMNDPNVDDERNWKGENRLGKLLNKVRKKLQ